MNEVNVFQAGVNPATQQTTSSYNRSQLEAQLSQALRVRQSVNTPSLMLNTRPYLNANASAASIGQQAVSL